MGYLRPNGTTASGEPAIDPQEFTKRFTLLPQTGKLMRWEVQGNCFSVSLQRLIQTVAIAVVGAVELLALPFRAALFFSCGLCADQVTIVRTSASKNNAPSSESADPISSSSDKSSSDTISSDNSTETEFSGTNSEKLIKMLIEEEEEEERSEGNAGICIDTENFQFYKFSHEFWKGVRRKLKDKLPNLLTWKTAESKGIFHEILRESYIEKYRLKELIEKFINPISAEEFNHEGLYPIYLKLCKDIQNLPNIHNLEWCNDDKSIDDILEIISFISYSPVVKYFYHHILPNDSKESDATSSYASEWKSSPSSSSDSEALMLIPSSLSLSDGTSSYESEWETNSYRDPDLDFIAQLEDKLRRNKPPQFNPQLIGDAITPPPRKKPLSEFGHYQRTGSTGFLSGLIKRPNGPGADHSTSLSPLKARLFPSVKHSLLDHFKKEDSRAPSSPSSDDDIDDLILEKSNENKAHTPPPHFQKTSLLMKRTNSFPSMELPAFLPKQAPQAASGNDIAYDLSNL